MIRKGSPPYEGGVDAALGGRGGSLEPLGKIKSSPPYEGGLAFRPGWFLRQLREATKK